MRAVPDCGFLWRTGAGEAERRRGRELKLRPRLGCRRRERSLSKHQQACNSDLRSASVKRSLRRRLDRMRADYEGVVGRPFSYCHCPIIFRDENTAICKAHIINQAFCDESDTWTIQRSDIDNFYGSYFESDFVALEYHERCWDPLHILRDRRLARLFAPRLVLDGEEVEYYFHRGECLPPGVTWVALDEEGTRAVVVKIPPERFARVQRHEIGIDKDARVASLVSLIKAAHLTLFELLGYRYALSPSGRFVGRDVLGEFHIQNSGANNPRAKIEVLKRAETFFGEFRHMVRPCDSISGDIKGTVSDGVCLLCGASKERPWGLVVFIGILGRMHAVLVPNISDAESVSIFLSFLSNERDTIEGAWGRFDLDRQEFDCGGNSITLNWPKTGTLWPDCVC